MYYKRQGRLFVEGGGGEGGKFKREGRRGGKEEIKK